MYWVYGLQLASNIAFPHLPEASTSAGETPDLILGVQQTILGNPASLANDDRLLWQSGPQDSPSLSICEIDGTIRFRYHHWIEFFVDARLSKVTCLSHPDLNEEWIQHLFLSLVSSFILHRRGFHNLHAGAVKVENEAVAFLAPTGGGKSTLTAYFVSAGHSLLGEDLLPLQHRSGDVWALPGPAQLRLCPDSAAKVWSHAGALPHHALQSGKRQVRLPLSGHCYCHEPLPLRAVYFLERSQGKAIRLEPLSQRESLLGLIGSAFGNFLLNTELLSRQMAFFVQIIPTLNCKRLYVPSDFGQLPSVYETIRADLAATKTTAQAR